MFLSHNDACRSVELALRGVDLLRGSRVLFSGLNLEAVPGDAVAIMGPSGIGKTSLLRALAGQQGGIRLSESVPWFAEQIPTNAPRPIGLMLQPDPIPGWLTVGAFLRAHHLASNEGHQGADPINRAYEVCHQVGLDFKAIRRQFGRELSHGMRSRVGVAGLMLLSAMVNLVDEPFAGVDEPQREQLLPVLKERLAGPGKLLLVVTHSPLEAMYLADRILLMPSDGRKSLLIDVPTSAHDLSSFLPESRTIRDMHERILAEIDSKECQDTL